MSAAETERTLSEYLDVLLSGGDFASFFADDITWTTMENGDQIHGRQPVADFIIAMHTQGFTAAPELVNLTVADGVGAIEAVFAGKHIGEFAGVAATGKDVRFPYAVGYDVSDGKITALRAYFPLQALVQQLTDSAT
jgi:steroid delta-isomerase-like uncharacterized protein